MVNLLPTEDKKFIRREFLRRFVNVLGAALLILIFVEIIFSLILLFFVSSFSGSVYDQLQITKTRAESENLEALENRVENINGLLSFFSSKESAPKEITGNMARILDILPGNIALDSIMIDGSVFVLQGNAGTRDSLLDFMQDLEKVDCSGVSCFKEISLPVSNLLANKNIDFSLSVKVNSAN